MIIKYIFYIISSSEDDFQSTHELIKNFTEDNLNETRSLDFNFTNPLSNNDHDLLNETKSIKLLTEFHSTKDDEITLDKITNNFSQQILDDENLQEDLTKKKRLTINGNQTERIEVKIIPMIDENDDKERTINADTFFTSFLNSYIVRVLSSIYQPLFKIVVYKNVSKENNSAEDNTTSVITDNKPEYHIDLLQNDTNLPETNKTLLDEIISKIYKIDTTTPITMDSTATEFIPLLEGSDYTDNDSTDTENIETTDATTKNIIERVQSVTITQADVTTTSSTTENSTILPIPRTIITNKNTTMSNLESLFAETQLKLQNTSLELFKKIISNNHLPFSSKYLQNNTQNIEIGKNQQTNTNNKTKKIEKRDILFQPDYSDERQELMSYYRNGEQLRKAYLNSPKTTDQYNSQRELIADGINDDKTNQFNPYAGQGLFLRNPEDFHYNLPTEESQNIPTEINDSSMMYLIDGIDYSLLEDTENKYMTAEKKYETQTGPLQNRKQLQRNGSKNSKRTITTSVHPTQRRRNNKRQGTKKSVKHRPKTTRRIKKNSKNTQKHNTHTSNKRRIVKNRNGDIIIYHDSKKPISTLNFPVTKTNKPKKSNNKTNKQ